ncbi:MAG: AI-2E family transporter [Candidatus Gracilibacteria bacterium]
MKEKKLTHYLEAGAENFKKLRTKLQELKKEHDEQSKFILPRGADKEDEQNRKENVEIHFSLASVAKATIVVIALIALSQFVAEIGKILLIFFISILFASALTPTVDLLEKRYRVPRPLSVIGMFLILLLILGFFISQMIPLVVTQLFELAKSMSSLLNKFSDGSMNLPFGEKLQPILQGLADQVNKEMIIQELKQAVESFATELQGFAGNTFQVIKTVFDGIFNFIVVLVLTFFLVVNEKAVNGFFISLFPSKHGSYIAEKIDAIQEKVGYWLRGQMVLMLAMFSFSLIGLLILGIDNALTLAMMTGIAELIPVIGPIGAGIPAVLTAFNESPWLAVWVLGLIILLQQIEGHILVPLVMRRAVGLNPIIIILAMLVGLETLGIVGMIVAVPVATTLSIFVNEYARKKK